MKSFTTAAPSRILTSPTQSRSGGGRCTTSSTWSCLASWSPPWRCWASRCPRTPGRSWDCVSEKIIWDTAETIIPELCPGPGHCFKSLQSPGLTVHTVQSLLCLLTHFRCQPAAGHCPVQHYRGGDAASDQQHPAHRSVSVVSAPNSCLMSGGPRMARWHRGDLGTDWWLMKLAKLACVIFESYVEVFFCLLQRLSI